MSIADELITRGHQRGSSGMWWEDGGGVCLLGAAGASLGISFRGHDVWRGVLPKAVEDALYDAVVDADSSYASQLQAFRVTTIFCYSDDASTDDVLRVAKHADELLDGAASRGVETP